MGITGTEPDIMSPANWASTRSLPVSEVLLGSAALLNRCHSAKSHDLQVYMEPSLFSPATKATAGRGLVLSCRVFVRRRLFASISGLKGYELVKQTPPGIRVFIQGSGRFYRTQLLLMKGFSVQVLGRIRRRTSSECVADKAGNKVEDPGSYNRKSILSV